MCAALYSITGEVVSPFCRLSITSPIHVRPEWIFFFFSNEYRLYSYSFSKIKPTVELYCIKTWSYLCPLRQKESEQAASWWSKIRFSDRLKSRWQMCTACDKAVHHGGDPIKTHIHLSSAPIRSPPLPGVSIIGEIPWRPPSLILASVCVRLWK